MNVFVIVYKYLFLSLYSFIIIHTLSETLAPQRVQNQFAHRDTPYAQAKIFCLKKFRKMKICFLPQRRHLTRFSTPPVSRCRTSDPSPPVQLCHTFESSQPGCVYLHSSSDTERLT